MIPKKIDRKTIYESQWINLYTDEVNEIHWLSITKVKELIANNEIQDGISLIPLLFYLNDVSHNKYI